MSSETAGETSIIPAELIELAARGEYESDDICGHPPLRWEDASDDVRELFWRSARAALTPVYDELVRRAQADVDARALPSLRTYLELVIR